MRTLMQFFIGTGVTTDTLPKVGSSSSGGDPVQELFNVFYIVMGSVAVIMLIIAGINFMISRGESSAIAKARSTLLSVIFGIILLLFAGVIVNFIVGWLF